MDLFAYMKIADLDRLAKANGIDVARLRGYRWMGDQTPYTEEDIQECLDRFRQSEYSRMEHHAEDLLESIIMRVNAESEIPGDDLTAEDIDRWKKRREWDIDNALSDLTSNWIDIGSYPDRFRKQAEKYNSYCGRKDVLMIHSRVGSGAYKYQNESWFLDCVLDAYDSTYVDIYAKLTILPEDLPEDEGKE